MKVDTEMCSPFFFIDSVDQNDKSFVRSVSNDAHPTTDFSDS